MVSAIDLAERGLLPDFVLRLGIRGLLYYRLWLEGKLPTDVKVKQFADKLRKSPLAVHQDAANQQHYEVPTGFYEASLGKRKKYSGCFWPEGTRTLDEAEEHSLRQVCERAELVDGQRVLELGCGWGSLSLWMAENFPNSQIVAISNSRTQREFIESKGFSNLKVITKDICEFSPEGEFDRIVSIEMFEHLRNYEELFKRISSWLKDEGKLFFHIFCHEKFPYFFETEGKTDWMGKYFFTGGQMPARKLFHEFQKDLKLENHWEVNGTHYGKTAEAWLSLLDTNREEVIGVFSQDLDRKNSELWYHRWRIFYMACAELFNFRSGHEWKIGHYLFSKNKS